MNRTDPNPPRPASRRTFDAACRLVAATALLVVALPSRADDDERRPRSGPPPAVVQHECGSCHLVFPAGALPADSWRRLMRGLPQHFGSDASLDDAASARAIEAWLLANAGTGQRARQAPPEDRITRSAWFLHEHDEIRAAVWQRAAVGRPSNCAACHQAAEQGDFDEDTVRIPR